MASIDTASLSPAGHFMDAISYAFPGVMSNVPQSVVSLGALANVVSLYTSALVHAINHHAANDLLCCRTLECCKLEAITLAKRVRRRLQLLLLREQELDVAETTFVRGRDIEIED